MKRFKCFSLKIEMFRVSYDLVIVTVNSVPRIVTKSKEQADMSCLQ